MCSKLIIDAVSAMDYYEQVFMSLAGGEHG
jgi:hypothetical protein